MFLPPLCVPPPFPLSDLRSLPPSPDLDYGEPSGLCAETTDSSGVFVREWTKSTVTVDCSSYSSTIKFK
jgi:hypothetical protein